MLEIGLQSTTTLFPIGTITFFLGGGLLFNQGFKELVEVTAAKTSLPVLTICLGEPPRCIMRP